MLPEPFNANEAARLRAARRLPVPVEVRCGDCGKTCRDASGAVRTTRDRTMREDFCAECKAFHAVIAGF